MALADRPLNSTHLNSDDLLWQQLKTLPAFRALLRAVEARFYKNLDLPQPVLDIGCGDGHFAQMAFDHPLQVGIDPWWGPLNKAERSGVYALPLQAMGDNLPFPDYCFASAFSNSVLEHIPDIQPVLNEVGRVLQPGAPFVMTVPSHYFTAYLGGAEFLDRLGLIGLAGNYRNLFNRISRHAHTDSPEVWAERLAEAGFLIERWQYYFSHGALHALELGHAQGLPSVVLHAITGHWIIGPWENNLKWTERWVRPYYEEGFPEEGAYIFFLARKHAGSPLNPSLPLANPFTLEELAETSGNSLQNASITVEDLDRDLTDNNNQKSDADASHGDRNQKKPSPFANWQLIIPSLLVGFILLFASWGQSALRASPGEPGDGIRWFGLSALTLLFLLWNKGFTPKLHFPSLRLPDIKQIPQRRWLYLLALFLSLLAPRFVVPAGNQRPIIAITIWLVATAIAFYALYNQATSAIGDEAHRRLRVGHFTLVAAGILFLAALLIRIYDLSHHPFILNGTEASIGLDALGVLKGTIKNPFSTGWLTNPTLPLFLLAIPLEMLGPSVLSLRLFSPFVGAATVVATFLIGQHLYGRAVGLTAAILLLGSHFHVHYSRLGLTNIWDALLVLLALGFIAIAWQQKPEQNRRIWLVAGLVIGFAAYFFSASHLLPLMLPPLLLLALIFERHKWREQWRNVVAMAALALVVALPQLLHYQANPNLYMERATVLGILDSQGGWLGREAARTGTSQLQLLSQQLWRSALAFNATLDTGTSYGPSVPLLSFAAGMLAILGFILAFLRSQRLRYNMLIVWVVITIIFAGALLLSPPNSHRFIISAPAICLLAAIALIELTNAITDRAKTRDTVPGLETSPLQSKALLLIVPLLIAATIASFDIRYYFGQYRNQHHFGDRNTEIAYAMADYLNSLEGDWSAYFYGPPSMYADFPTIPFLVENFQKDVNLFDVLESGTDLPPSESSNLVFLFLPERVGELGLTKLDFPAGQEQIFNGYYSNPLFHVYEVLNNS